MVNLRPKDWDVYTYLARWEAHHHKRGATSDQVFAFADRTLGSTMAYQNIHRSLNTLADVSGGLLVVKESREQVRKRKGKVQPRWYFKLEPTAIELFHKSFEIDPSELSPEELVANVLSGLTVFKKYIENPLLFKRAIKRLNIVLEESGLETPHSRANLIMSVGILEELLKTFEVKQKPFKDQVFNLGLKLQGLRNYFITDYLRQRAEVKGKKGKRSRTPRSNAAGEKVSCEFYSSFYQEPNFLIEHYKYQNSYPIKENE